MLYKALGYDHSEYILLKFLHWNLLPNITSDIFSQTILITTVEQLITKINNVLMINNTKQIRNVRLDISQKNSQVLCTNSWQNYYRVIHNRHISATNCQYSTFSRVKRQSTRAQLPLTKVTSFAWINLYKNFNVVLVWFLPWIIQ